MNCAHVIQSRKILRSWIIRLPEFLVPMSEGAGVTQSAGLGLGVVPAELGLVLDVRKHLLLHDVDLLALGLGRTRVPQSRWVVKLAMLLVLFGGRKIVFGAQASRVGQFEAPLLPQLHTVAIGLFLGVSESDLSR